MSLVAYGPDSESAPEPIDNNGFWPAIAPAHFREVNRVDTSITDERVIFALSVALTDVNRQLADWQAQQVEGGANTITDVAVPPWAVSGQYELLYRQAVYSTAHAFLLERYRDHSATSEGDERGEAKDAAADDYRRDARWAVSEILGTTHTTVELI